MLFYPRLRYILFMRIINEKITAILTQNLKSFVLGDQPKQHLHGKRRGWWIASRLLVSTSRQIGRSFVRPKLLSKEHPIRQILQQFGTLERSLWCLDLSGL